jgi:hypothetical protein
MKYLKAYFKAWWDLIGYAFMGYYSLVAILYVFGLKMDSLVVPYLLYVVSLVAVGGVVREGMK